MNSKFKIKNGRIELLKAMHLLMQSTNDEGAYWDWICTFPDDPSEDDYESVADDDELYGECCEEFRRLLEEYGESGFYVWDDKKSY